MGRAKEAYMESMERGWDAPEDKYVCCECVEDAHLKVLIEENLACHKCSYCGKSSREYISAPVEAIMPAISSAIHYYYNDFESACVPHDSDGYIFELQTTTYDVLEGISLDCHEDLYQDVSEAFHNPYWIEAAYGHWNFSHLSERMAMAWKNFVHTVKHECRYFFSAIPVDEISSEEMSPIILLRALGKMVLDLNLIETMSSETELYRVRTREKGATWVLDFDQLGPPPNDKARAGRMNPAGISYFYLAKDSQTAFAEAIQKPPCNTALSCFKTSKDLRLLNLCDIPSMPSIFDESGYEQRELICFLLDFVKQISEPISKNGQEHIDYVASQIVSEFFAKEFRTETGDQIHGLTYPSSVHTGGVNVILFPPEKNGLDGFKDLASLESSKEVSINSDKLFPSCS